MSGTLQTPRSPTAAASSPEISYALESGHRSATASAAARMPGSWTGMVTLFVAVGAVALLLGPWSPVATGLGVVAIIVAAAAATVARRLARRPGPIPAHLRTLPARPDRRARVACVGKHADQARVAALGEIGPRFFEPVHRYAPVALPLGFEQRAVWTLLTVAGLAATGVLLWPSRVTYLGAAASAVIGVAGCITGALWPTYLRVVPGRIDVLRFSALGRRVVEVRRHDLRSSAVLVDLNSKCVFLADRDGRTREVGFGSVWRPEEVAHAVLLAAVSNAQPPPLPDDALTG